MLSKIIRWVARLVPAFIMLQTLFFKFSGSEESIYIFTKVGMEPWGRYGVGFSELVAAILILVPRTSWLGGGITVGLMFGAISMHIFILGVEVMDDGGQLFIYAILALLGGLYTLWVDKEQVRQFLRAILSK